MYNEVPPGHQKFHRKFTKEKKIRRDENSPKISAKISSTIHLKFLQIDGATLQEFSVFCSKNQSEARFENHFHAIS